MENLQTSNCITLDELQQLVANKTLQVKIIDVRSKEEYNESHIPGAINIAILDIELANNLFAKTDFIITACGKGGGRSTQAAEKLQELGFKNATWLCGGTFGWIQN
ncbi:MAG: rhodanese-like domain-containing protein [Bacteroidia bacterium]|jgi:rhodanese-related sulfurtransferase|nr:rhodanese-like domain-containing protein [Bacteroidia bacterium]